MQEIINKVTQSGIITINLADFLPPNDSYILLDIKNYLFMGMILKEKEFRQQLAETDWSQYNHKVVIIHCSVDAIIPSWAYMLFSQYLINHSVKQYIGNIEDFLHHTIIDNINKMDASIYLDKRVVIKGCSDTYIPVGAYAYITSKLLPVVKSLMYGEPCSTVPIYKRANLKQ